jgi:hypothetical protein
MEEAWALRTFTMLVMGIFLPKSSLDFGSGSFQGSKSPSTTCSKSLISLVEVHVSIFYKKILNSGGAARRQNAGLNLNH